MGTRAHIPGCVVVAFLGLVSQATPAEPMKALDPAAVEAERQVAPAQTSAMEESATKPSAYTRLTQAFNPQISAILQGRLAYLSEDPGERQLPGYLLGGETGRGPEGLALGESELVFSANVDDKLYGFLNVSFDQEEIGIEEAYLSTLSLPLGLGLKAGQFLSAVGYQNQRHSHTWDFIDQPLIYEAMLGGGLADPGLQITWVAPTDLYLELGAEIMRGDAYPSAGAPHDGFGTAVGFARLSGDLGDSHSWMTSLSYLRSESDGRESDAGTSEPFSFTGSSDLVNIGLVWKWAPLGNFKQRNITLQTEYMHRHETGALTSNAMPGRLRSDQDGVYVQGVYQFMPRWRVGLRYGQLWSDNGVTGLPRSVVDRDFSSPRRTSAMIDFSNSEFSRIRLQYSFESGGLGDDSLIYLQYIISIGSHGAHSF